MYNVPYEFLELGEIMESFFQLALDTSDNECLYEQVEFSPKVQFIDLRSPCEFYESSIPGAVNIPIFSNEERSEVGTIYRQNGENAARWRAMELVSPKIPTILTSIKQFSDRGLKPVIYCWRGGMRSKSISYFANLAGLKIFRLVDGYRGYRKYILEKSYTLFPNASFVLHGKTGVGKTEILQVLSSQELPVIDLEKAANHKGSIFGSFGMGLANSQKMFDSYLYQQILSIQGSGYCILEAESKRIGKVSVPLNVLDSIKNGVHILIKRSISDRVERIYKEYVKDLEFNAGYSESLDTILQQLCKRIPNKQIVENLKSAFNTKDYRIIIQILMEHYYDPKYTHKEESYDGDFYVIESDDNEVILSEIKRIIQFSQKKLAKV